MPVLAPEGKNGDSGKVEMSSWSGGSTRSPANIRYVTPLGLPDTTITPPSSFCRIPCGTKEGISPFWIRHHPDPETPDKRSHSMRWSELRGRVWVHSFVTTTLPFIMAWPNRIYGSASRPLHDLKAHRRGCDPQLVHDRQY